MSVPQISLKNSAWMIVRWGMLGGCLGFWAGHFRAVVTRGVDEPSALKHPPAKASSNRSEQLRDVWLDRCQTASTESIAHWAQALAAAPRWLIGQPGYRAELTRLIIAHGIEGIQAALLAGVSGERLAWEIQGFPAPEIPRLLTAVFSYPERLAVGDLGMIAFAALHAGANVRDALAPLAAHLQKFYPLDEETLRSVSIVIGRGDPNFVSVLTAAIPNEASQEVIQVAAIYGKASSSKLGPELTTEIENMVVGRPSLQKMFESVAAQKAFPDKAPEVIAWALSLQNFERSAALRGWVTGLQEEYAAISPVACVLKEAGAVQDVAFFSKVIEIAAPKIQEEGPVAAQALTKLLDARPDRAQIMTNQPLLKMLVEGGNEPQKD